MSRHAAFTLVEILASVLLFALGVMAVIGVVAHGLRSAARAQAEASAWATAACVLKDPLPLGASGDAGGSLQRWSWSRAGDTWTAVPAEGGEAAWRCTVWDLDAAGDVLVPDMGDPQANNPAVFPPGGAPLAGCANGWLNGYYVERREQSRAADRLGRGVRLVEVRVDVYWTAYLGADGRPLASLVDRCLRQAGP